MMHTRRPGKFRTRAAFAACAAGAALGQDSGWRAIGEPARPAIVKIANFAPNPPVTSPPQSPPAQSPPALLPSTPPNLPAMSPPPAGEIAAPMPAATPDFKPVLPPAELKILPPGAGPALNAPPRNDDPAPKKALPAMPVVGAAAAPTTYAGTLPLSSALYRPIARLVAESEPQHAPSTPNELLQSSAWPPRDPLPADTRPIDAMLPQSPTLTMSDLATCSPWWAEPLEFRGEPAGALWLPPAADPRSPRISVQSLRINGASAIDASLGGEIGIFRVGPVRRTDEGVQLDLLGAAFSRFDERKRLAALDFRAGIPLTYAKGAFSMKFGYEHESAHVGDEYAAATGATQVQHVRDELATGFAWEWSRQLRTYGQAAYAFHIRGPFAGRSRYGVGAEWLRRGGTGPFGRPFAALDCQWREDQGYALDLTAQTGWQWRVADTGRAFRLAIERHTGNSPFGQFYLSREPWWGLSAAADW